MAKAQAEVLVKRPSSAPPAQRPQFMGTSRPPAARPAAPQAKAAPIVTAPAEPLPHEPPELSDPSPEPEPKPKSNEFTGQRVPAEERTTAQPFAHPVPDDFPFDSLERPLKSKEVDSWRYFANAYIGRHVVSGTPIGDEELAERGILHADRMMTAMRRRRYIHDKD